jgi:hypothetical protein
VWAISRTYSGRDLGDGGGSPDRLLVVMYLSALVEGAFDLPVGDMVLAVDAVGVGGVRVIAGGRTDRRCGAGSARLLLAALGDARSAPPASQVSSSVTSPCWICHNHEIPGDDEVPSGPSEEGRLMNQDTAGSSAAPDGATAGASPPAGRTGQATQRYEVRPVGWVESPLKHRAQAPRQGSEGAPPAWLAGCRA